MCKLISLVCINIHEYAIQNHQWSHDIEYIHNIEINSSTFCNPTLSLLNTKPIQRELLFGYLTL
jgi:hypothetical protein